MKADKKCEWKECWPAGKIVGALFLLVATVLTLLTLNGLGIFGMFIVGLMLCRHHHSMCGCNCHQSGCSPCDTTVCDDMSMSKPKKTASKK